MKRDTRRERPTTKGKPDDSPTEQSQAGSNKCDRRKTSRPATTGKDSRKEQRGLPTRNDWSWYAVDEVIARQVGSIPFNVLAGSRVPTSIGGLSNGTTAGKDYFVGSTTSLVGATVHYVPSVGVSTDASSGISLAANQLYAEMRKVNSGAKNYEAPDLLMFVLAVQDVMRYMMEVNRALRFLNRWTYRNKFLPISLLSDLMNVDYEDLAANYAQYCGEYNTLVTTVNSLGIPSYFTSTLRKVYLAGNVFQDSDAESAQLLVFDALGYYTWDTTSSTTGTSLKWHWKYSQSDDIAQPTKRKLSEAISDIRTMLRALLTDTDALTMEGDIQKAWGTENLAKLPLFEYGSDGSCIVDEDILAQFENIIVPPFGVRDTDAWSATSFDVSQKNGSEVVFMPTTKYVDLSDSNARKFCVRDALFNSHKENPEYTDTLEWSRLMAAWELQGTTLERAMFHCVACGQELPIGVTFTQYYYISQAPGQYKVQEAATFGFEQVLWSASSSAAIYGTSAMSAILPLCSLMQMDWHPFVYVAYGTPGSDPSVSTQLTFGGDCKWLTVIHHETLVKIHESVNYAAYYNRSLK